MMRQILYPCTRLTILLNQLMEETNQNLISSFYVMLFISQTSYLPQEKEHQFCSDVTNFFFKKALREQENEELQRFCIDKGLQMLYNPELIKLASTWVLERKITIDGQDLKVNLTEDQKYAIIVKVWASQQFSQEQKDTLMAKAMEGDESDKGKKAK